MAENDNCTYQNPLIRDGVSQEQRMPEALDPEYIKVDERNLADLLRFVNHYAELLQYYKTDNTPDGDWRPFFERDMTSIIVMLTDENPDQYMDCLEELEAVVYDDSATLQEVRNAFKTVFDITATLAVELDLWYKESVEGYAFNGHLDRLIRSELRPALQKMIAYYKGALVGTDMVNEDYKAPEEKFGKSLVSFPDLEEYKFDSIWIDPAVEAENWKEYVGNTITSDTSIYQTDSSAVQARAKEGFPVIRKMVRSFIGAVKTTQQQVPEFVEETLESYSAYEPHMGLLLTFFQLFRHAQEQMNTLTGRHLDFYYEEVLRLARNDAVPDQVHLIAELAKHVDSHKIDKGTLFKAGEDDQGNEVLYQATEEVVLNKATIEQLKSIYIDKEDEYRIYEKPVANSKEGLGTELENPSDGWKPFGESQLKAVTDDGKIYFDEPNASMQFSSIGFALSSPVLNLAEGKREITVTIDCIEKQFKEASTQKGQKENFTGLLDIYVTGPEGWINVRDFDVSPVFKRENTKYTISFAVVREVPPIVGYDVGIHGPGYQTSYPILKVTLSNTRNTSPYAYGFLRQRKINTVDIAVSVEGVKNLVLQNELGPLDPGKPFQPFGPKPSTGSAFYIGSPEAFAKDLDSLSVRVKWHEFPKKKLEDYYNYDPQGDMVGTKDYGTSISNSDFEADIEILNNGNWETAIRDVELFPDNLENERYIINENGLAPFNFSIGWEPALEPFSRYDVSLNRGFIRLILSSPDIAFGHGIYSRLLMQQLQNDNEIPVEPYTPKIKSIELDYTASVSLNSAENDANTPFDQIYQLYPFGTSKALEGRGRRENLYLLPRFRHVGSLGDIDHTGEFFIGLSGLKPPQQISLLVKMAEGSGDPTLQPPDVHWFYLSEEGWKLFKSADIVTDTTNGLLDSGILRFNMPKGAVNETTQLPGKLFWIKAAVERDTAALSRVIDIHTQALKAEFVDRNNDPEFLSEALPAGTISKLKSKQSEIKQIQQPYASEGGKVAERDEEYYRRVNERLRHKDRGVSVWDYERLVLQQFPSIYKAKCINHSVYGLEMNGSKMNAEFAPGYVTVIVVPDLSGKNAFNPLEPRVSLNLLEEIECYLKKKISLFAAENLQVSNPLFEQVQVEFYVEFVAGKDEGFYRSKLAEDITAFLSPWAYKEGKEISFGGSIHKSVILNFVEERSYVDFVTDFKMHHFVGDSQKSKNVNEITASEARSVLASHHTHKINGQSISVV